MASTQFNPVGHRDVQNIINLCAAIVLFASPWAFGFAADSVASKAAWVGGFVIAVMAVAAMTQFAEWEEWVSAAVGLIAIAAPWLLQFATLQAARDAFVVLGAIVVLASLSEIWVARHPTVSMM